MKFIISTALLLISTILYGQKNTMQIAKKNLPGHWVSADDKKYTIVATDTTFIEYYDNKKTGVFLYKIDKNELIKTDKEDGEVYKYDILSLTSRQLTLLYLDRGNILKFIKRK